MRYRATPDDCKLSLGGWWIAWWSHYWRCRVYGKKFRRREKQAQDFGRFQNCSRNWQRRNGDCLWSSADIFKTKSRSKDTTSPSRLFWWSCIKIQEGSRGRWTSETSEYCCHPCRWWAWRCSLYCPRTCRRRFHTCWQSRRNKGWWWPTSRVFSWSGHTCCRYSRSTPACS